MKNFDRNFGEMDAIELKELYDHMTRNCSTAQVAQIEQPGELSKDPFTQQHQRVFRRMTALKNGFNFAAAGREIEHIKT